MKTPCKRGFSLIEVLVVITAMAVFYGGSSVVFSQAKEAREFLNDRETLKLAAKGLAEMAELVGDYTFLKEDKDGLPFREMFASDGMSEVTISRFVKFLPFDSKGKEAHVKNDNNTKISVFFTDENNQIRSAGDHKLEILVYDGHVSRAIYDPSDGDNKYQYPLTFTGGYDLGHTVRDDVGIVIGPFLQADFILYWPEPLKPYDIVSLYDQFLGDYLVYNLSMKSIEKRRSTDGHDTKYEDPLYTFAFFESYRTYLRATSRGKSIRGIRWPIPPHLDPSSPWYEDEKGIPATFKDINSIHYRPIYDPMAYEYNPHYPPPFQQKTPFPKADIYYHPGI